MGMQELQCLLPLLNEFKLVTNSESALAEMAANLSISIATYCGVTFNKTSTKTSKPLIEEIDPNEVIIKLVKKIKKKVNIYKLMTK